MDVESDTKDGKKLVAVVLGLSTVIGLMLLAFALPSVNSGAHELKLGIAGSTQETSYIAESLDENKSGEFAIEKFADIDGVRDAIQNRDVVGGIVVDASGTRMLIATAGGASIAQTLTGAASALSEASGSEVLVEDLVPLTTSDPTGAGLTALALPLIFGGMMPAVALVHLFPRNVVARMSGAIGVAALSGFILTAILQFGTHSLPGNYVLTSLALSMGISAISLTVLGFESLLGKKGFALGAITMMFIANPLSGMATTGAWLPSGWGTFGQMLPPGAAGAAIRSLAFFDGHGARTPILLLACWIAFGIGLTALARKKDLTTTAATLEVAPA